MKNLLWPVVLFIVILIAAAALVLIPAPHTAVAPNNNGTTTPNNSQTGASLDDLIVVTSPLPGSTVGYAVQDSDLRAVKVSGKARGSWYFEASAPYILKNASGTTIAQGNIQALSDWMTSDFVPFSVIIDFPPQPAGSTGTLVLKNDNPSGDPARNKELDIPVTF